MWNFNGSMIKVDKNGSLNIKINSRMKLISIIMISILLLSCHKEKQEYIEVSLGFSMNPNEPRIGILINDKDSLYVCMYVCMYVWKI
ncbi:hypothetical protein QF044_001548 [Chryseobacterium sp. W4I1]|nr:hypothetical protein [Chryseobacterium sp. W4I1]